MIAPDESPELPPQSPHGVSQHAPWMFEDMMFAVEQIAQEYTALARDRVTAAVNSAVALVSPSVGRVRLLQCAREMVRPLH